MMNQQDIFKKIGNILTELNEQYQFLAQNPDRLNDLELELFLANAHFLSDHVNIVQKLNVMGNEVKSSQAELPISAKKEEIVELLAEQSYKEDEECFDPETLEEVVTAEEEEQRIDVKPEQELLDDEIIHAETTEKILENDFFKPDHNPSFEFVLGDHDENDKFDFEEKPVSDIFDRPLTKAEEEILAQKKRIHEKEESPSLLLEELSADEEDEIGPEPFLIEAEEKMDELPEIIEEEIAEPIPSEPIEALKGTDLDDSIISPSVDDRPIFTPEAIPVKPVVQPIAEKPATTLNDLLAKGNGHTEPVQSPIADLKQAINLNEKLLFIKDLFNGYNLAYSEAIDLVNKMTNFEMADTFLKSNYAIKNNWAAKQTTVDQFYELLNRRFAK